ncbi:class I SAM-dependent methyltransferase [Salinibacter ruber]|uniref:class I SAM-dependent methyltransferase n=1 Tax=Salinibacter ruber TaxID=146919 RepID=UPI002169D261|nr:class I SAM-dependent methyltransferase [Salinibacter ruber]MCS3638158.1 SAM-dependent methyltransferase [Salinibacter ruber]
MVDKIKDLLKGYIEESHYGHNALLRIRNKVSGPHREPNYDKTNSILKNKKELKEALNEIDEIGLPKVGDEPKNWDSLSALTKIINSTTKDSKVLDAGGEKYSMILPWLSLYGYKNLEAINIAFDRTFKKGPITYKKDDITSTTYDRNTFDAVTCLSVIEHGVEVDDYLEEMSRILKDNGILLTSTDYSKYGTETGNKKAYGTNVRVFTEEGIKSLLDEAKKNNLSLDSRLIFEDHDNVVRWERMDLEFTYIIMCHKKNG